MRNDELVEENENLLRQLEDAINDQREISRHKDARIDDLTSEMDGWKSELQMYDTAWGRELKMLIPKVHRIDSLVLTTRQIVAENESMKEEKVFLENEIKDLQRQLKVWRV